MAINPAFRDFVAELLAPLGPVGLRAMFGGAGIFYGGTMFGLLAQDTVYFKVGEGNRADFEAAGSDPFAYRGRNGREIALSYYALPEALLEDQDLLLDWARKAVAAALEAARREPLARRRPDGISRVRKGAPR